MNAIDSREEFINGDEIPQRITELERASELEEWENDELIALRDFYNDLQDLLGIDYLMRNNPTIVRASYFETYARESAYDMGDVREDGSVDSYVDWKAYAAAVQQDWSDVDFDGITYLVRG